MKLFAMTVAFFAINTVPIMTSDHHSLVDRVHSVSSLATDELETNIYNKVGEQLSEKVQQSMMNQSLLGLEYLTKNCLGGMADISLEITEIVKGTYVEIRDLLEFVTDDYVDHLRDGSLLESIKPDFSPYYFLCPKSCHDCTLSISEILCRICCPDMFPTPLAYTAMVMESTYTYTARVIAWIQNQLSSSGLRLVYLYWALKDSSNNQNTSMQEMQALIRNFQWEHQMKTGDVLNLENNSIWRPSEICGYYENTTRRTQGKIMGGEIVDKMRLYPWQVSLATGFLGMFYSHRCGGALLSELWVLTAAHCVESAGSLYVMGGFLDLDNRETAQIRSVREYFIHEDYKREVFEQDISLLKLSSPVVFSPSFSPICLPPSRVGYNTYVGTTAILTGWGRQWKDGPVSDQLQMVKLPIISNKECMVWYHRSGTRQFIPEHSFLCAGWEDGGKDACSGDSGGPLITFREDGRAEVVGIVSWGIGCGDMGRPGVYTRVTQFSSWIEEIIRKNS